MQSPLVLNDNFNFVGKSCSTKKMFLRYVENGSFIPHATFDTSMVQVVSAHAHNT